MLDDCNAVTPDQARVIVWGVAFQNASKRFEVALEYVVSSESKNRLTSSEVSDFKIIRSSLIKDAIMFIGTVYRSGNGSEVVGGTRGGNSDERFKEIMDKAMPDETIQKKFNEIMRYLQTIRSSFIAHADYKEMKAQIIENGISVNNGIIDFKPEDLAALANLCKSMAISCLKYGLPVEEHSDPSASAASQST